MQATTDAPKGRRKAPPPPIVEKKKKPRAAAPKKVATAPPPPPTKPRKAKISLKGAVKETIKAAAAPVFATPKMRKGAKALPLPVRSKLETVVAMLQRPAGATNAQIMAATGWQTHSVRGFLAQRKKAGMEISATDEGDPPVKVYRIVVAEVL